MQISEIKNNLVKIMYDPTQENLVLSGFVIVRDDVQAFIGQIINLEASDRNYALIKLLFTFDEQGVISNYNGAIPSITSQINIVFAKEVLELFPAEKPIFMGEVAQQGSNLVLDSDVFDQKTIICTEKQNEKDLLVKNFVKQLTNYGSKVLVIDNLGNSLFEQQELVAGKDFKLPLNYDTINFIYEKGLDDASGETKASIQEVFLEVQDYVKSLKEGYIPFETFRNVVDLQYDESELVELLLLKNKLLKYYDEGVFAQEEVDFKSLKNHLETQDLTVLNISDMDEAIQREMISYVYSIIEDEKLPIYVILDINNENSDKKLLKQIYTAKSAISIVCSQYNFKYLKEIKQLSKNVMMFAPIQQQNDFAGYNTFLNKLNEKECIFYGESTHHIPFIIALKELPQEFLENKINQEVVQEPTQEVVEVIPQIIEDDAFAEQNIEDNIDVEQQEISTEDIEEQKSEDEILDQQIKQDVDEIFTAPQNSVTDTQNNDYFDVQSIENESEFIAESLTDEDLDFIQENISDDIFEEGETQTQEISQSIPAKYSSEEGNSFAQVMQTQAQSAEIEPNEDEILPQEAASTPIVPVYSADVEPVVQSDDVVQGDLVTHAKYGNGVVEKLISYGDKTLYSINFDNVGRRLLDPNVTELKKI